MVPYIDIAPIEIGDFSIRIFDILVALAVVVGVVVADRRAGRLGLDQRVITDVALWAVIPGFIVSHLVSVIFYFPERIAENPLELFNIFSGMSSFGGFVGGAGGVLAYFRLKRRGQFWDYSEALVYGFTFAWIFGRLGCTCAHDHPGLATDFFLAVDYPASSGFPPGPRHDLGFYELLWALGMSLTFFLMRKRPRFTGWHLSIFLIAYTPLRFAADFLRVRDKTHLGLTAGQYLAIGLFLLGIWIWVSRSKVGHRIVSDGAVHILESGAPAVPPRPPVKPDESPS